jgi:hypothetical protein
MDGDIGESVCACSASLKWDTPESQKGKKEVASKDAAEARK